MSGLILKFSPLKNKFLLGLGLIVLNPFVQFFFFLLLIINWISIFFFVVLYHYVLCSISCSFPISLFFFSISNSYIFLYRNHATDYFHFLESIFLYFSICILVLIYIHISISRIESVMILAFGFFNYHLAFFI